MTLAEISDVMLKNIEQTDSMSIAKMTLGVPVAVAASIYVGKIRVR